MMSAAPPHHLPFATMKGYNNKADLRRNSRKYNRSLWSAKIPILLAFALLAYVGFPSNIIGDTTASITSARIESLTSLVSAQQQQKQTPSQVRRLEDPSSIKHEESSQSVAVAEPVVVPSVVSVEEQQEHPALPIHQQFGPPPHSRRLRVLFGILTADFKNDYAYRKRHRALFALWNDSRVCSLPDFKTRPLETRYECEIIYTFVLGGNPNATPELVDQSRPREVDKPVHGTVCPDLNEPDVTLLNIRENMNEGKSQTWMSYGAEIAEEYDLDYVTKCDADALLHLHEFFKFAYTHMPPAPYNKHVYIGALRDKAYWPRHKTEEARIAHESYFGNNFEGVHLYVAGQIYMMSTDLAKFVGQEALKNKCSYCEGHEDHDISAMAYHSDQPIKLLTVGRSHRFWEHPVKGEPRWKRMYARETARMAGEPFEGKMFSKQSRFEDVYHDDVAVPKV